MFKLVRGKNLKMRESGSAITKAVAVIEGTSTCVIAAAEACVTASAGDASSKKLGRWESFERRALDRLKENLYAFMLENRSYVQVLEVLNCILFKLY